MFKEDQPSASTNEKEEDEVFAKAAREEAALKASLHKEAEARKAKHAHKADVPAAAVHASVDSVKAHVAKVGMQADKRSDILAPTSAYEKGEVVSKSAPNSHHSPSQAQPKPQTRSNIGGWCSGTKSM